MSMCFLPHAFLFFLFPHTERLGVPLAESAVQWREVDGSKLIQTRLDVVKTSVTMLRDMLCVNIAYSLGLWKREKT